MKKVDWKKFANDHEMSKQEFADEIINTAIMLGSMYIDTMNTNSMSVTNGGYKMIIMQVEEPAKTVDIHA